MNRSLLPHTLALACLATVGAAHAQVIDEVDIRREGNDAVLQLRFATEIQYQRTIVTRSGDLVLVSYNLLTTTNSRLKTSNQVLRVKAARGLPDIEIADEFDRGEQGRRLVIRLSEPSQAAVRAGRNNRSIEIVLRGKGAGLARAPGTGTATQPAAAAVPLPTPRPQAPAPAPAPSATPAAPAPAPAEPGDRRRRPSPPRRAARPNSKHAPRP